MVVIIVYFKTFSFIVDSDCKRCCVFLTPGVCLRSNQYALNLICFLQCYWCERNKKTHVSFNNHSDSKLKRADTKAILILISAHLSVLFFLSPLCEMTWVEQINSNFILHDWNTSFFDTTQPVWRAVESPTSMKHGRWAHHLAVLYGNEFCMNFCQIAWGNSSVINKAVELNCKRN